MRVLRDMMAAEDGLPVIGTTGRYLGMRAGRDIPKEESGYRSLPQEADFRRLLRRG